MSYTSLMEMMGQVLLSEDLEYISSAKVIDVRKQTAIVAKLLAGLRKSQLK